MEKLHELDALVSVFDGVKTRTPLGTQSVFSIIDEIRTGGQWLEQILTLRKEYQRLLPIKKALDLIEDEDDKKIAKDNYLEQKEIIDNTYKKTLKGITFNGTFSIRNGESFLEPSGFAVIDFDGAENAEEMKELIIADDYCFSAFISPTGRGVKAIYRIPKETDTDKLKGRLLALLGFIKYKFKDEMQSGKVLVDESCVDIPRLCLTSYDSSIYVNEAAFVFDGIQEIKKLEHTAPTSLPKLNNEETQKVMEFVKNFIYEKFPDNMEEGTRYDTLKKLTPLFLGWVVYYGLDYNQVLNWMIERYGAQFEGYVKQERINSLRSMWNKYMNAGTIIPKPISEFNNLTPNNTEIKIDNLLIIENNDDVKDEDLEASIFDTEKALHIPPEEDLKLMEVDIFNKKKCRMQTETLLMKGSMFGVVATVSSGKTSMVNSILAQVLVDKSKLNTIHKIHFKITENVNRCLVFDSELDFYNYPKFYDQLCKRIGLDITHENLTKLRDSDKVDYFSMSEYSIITNKIDAMPPFKRLIQKAYDEGNPYSLVILDDITIFTPDINDSKDVPKILLTLKRMSKKYGFGIFATIHANSGDHTGKGRGHSGSELERKGETVLHMTRNNDTELFEITLGVGNKNRNGGLTFAMHDNPLIAEWKDDLGCIVGIDTMKTTEVKEERRIESKTPTIQEKVYDFISSRVKETFKKNPHIDSTTIKDWIMNFCIENNLGYSLDVIDKTHMRYIKKQIQKDGIAVIESKAGKPTLFIKPKSSIKEESIPNNVIETKFDDEIEMDTKITSISYNEKMLKEDEESLVELDKKTFNDSWIDDDKGW